MDNSNNYQNKINELGQKYGCHTCGTKTIDGKYIPDHQPPLKLQPHGAFNLLPHCPACAVLQAEQVTEFLKTNS